MGDFIPFFGFARFEFSFVLMSLVGSFGAGDFSGVLLAGAVGWSRVRLEGVFDINIRPDYAVWFWGCGVMLLI